MREAVRPIASAATDAVTTRLPARIPAPSKPGTGKPRSGLGFLWVLLALALGIIAWGLWNWYVYESGWNPERVERLVREGLPIGTPRRQVRAWLDSQPFHALPWVETHTGQVSGASIDNAPLSRQGGSGSIRIVFAFDQNDWLSGYTVQTREYSL